jgi:hypothetical protein
MWKDVYEPGSNPPRLLFRYDPERGIIETQRRGVKHIIDLASYRQVGTALGTVKESVEIAAGGFTTRTA